MTIPEFVAALKTTREAGYCPYVVTQSSRRMIRLRSPTGEVHCPITAVCEHASGETYPPMAVYSTLDRLGLGPDEAYTIVGAADGEDDEPILRQQLLAALALPDPVASRWR
jgi:hypothetical protein